MSGFQKQVNTYQAPGVVGARASMNPVSSVVAGPGELCAGASGVYVGRFAWNTYDTAGGPGEAGNQTLTAKKPAGFVANEQQALITVWLAESTLLVPEGLPVTEFDRGDFWAKSSYGEAEIGDKVFANVFTGLIMAAAAGSFPTDVVGTSSVIANASIPAGSYTLTVATITSGSIQVGHLLSGDGVPPGTYIESLGTGTGGTGTYYLSQAPKVAITAEAMTTVAPEGVGGATVSASANNGSPTLTIGTVTTGVVAAGQLVKGTGIPDGTYIAALGTSTGGTGTVTLSANTTATITAGSVELSAWVETDWYVKSAGNVGDIIKIGVTN